jgi:hypothetical protein
MAQTLSGLENLGIKIGAVHWQWLGLKFVLKGREFTRAVIAVS